MRGQNTPRAVACATLVVLAVIAGWLATAKDPPRRVVDDDADRCSDKACFTSVRTRVSRAQGHTPRWLQERTAALHATLKAQARPDGVVVGAASPARARLAGSMYWARVRPEHATPPTLLDSVIAAARWSPYFDHVLLLVAPAAALDQLYDTVAVRLGELAVPEQPGAERTFATLLTLPGAAGNLTVASVAAVLLRSSEAMQEWLVALNVSGIRPSGATPGIRVVPLKHDGITAPHLMSDCCRELSRADHGLPTDVAAEVPPTSVVRQAVANGSFALGHAADFTRVGDGTIDKAMAAFVASLGVMGVGKAQRDQLWVPEERLCRGQRACRAIPIGALPAAHRNDSESLPTERPRVAILGMYEAPRGEKAMDHEPLMAYDAQWNRRQYAARHGYDVVWEEPSIAPPGRTAHWAKITALARWLPHYDWVWWLDADAVITNLSRPITDVVDRYARGNDAAGFLVAREQVTGYLNTGSFLIRGRSDRSAAFLRAVYHTDTAHWKHYEQGAINRVLDDPAGGELTIAGGYGVVVPGRAINPFPPRWCVQTEAHEPGDLVVHMPGFKYCVGGAADYTLASLHRYAQEAAATYYSPAARRVEPCCVFRRVLYPPTATPLLSVKDILEGTLANFTTAPQPPALST